LTKESYVKIELFVPVFFGVLVSLFLSALIIRSPEVLETPETVTQIVEPYLSVEAAETEEFGEDDVIAARYLDAETRDFVLDFFAGVCGSPETAALILSNAAAFDIPPALAFALCWEESRYKPGAINTQNRNGSVDRGLFQLNNISFPKLETRDFFNPAINAYYGMGHLRWCLDAGGTEIAALAMYNAGTGRVQSLGAPRKTLDYIHRILEYRKKLETSFRAAAAKREQEDAGENLAALDEVDDNSKRPWLLRLSPLSGGR
jgi:hypothetical protein